jgi:adenylate cyclase
MAMEIERKFLVKGDTWRSLGSGEIYRQGYLATKEEATVRVRVVGDRGYLTIKGKTVGIARSEFEYSISVEDAQIMLDTLCDRPLIEKIRYKIPLGNLVWEVDEFLGENEGLILAEVELMDEQEAIELPDWLGAEISSDSRYYNANLVKYPYRQWEKKV